VRNITLDSKQEKKLVGLLEVELEVLMGCFHYETDDLEVLKEEIGVVVESLIQLDYEPKTPLTIDGYKLVDKWEG